MNKFTNSFTNILLADNVDQLIIKNFDDICISIPELKALQNFNQNNPYHTYDVLGHTMIVLKSTPSDLTLRLSALFHDVAKPLCYTIDEKGIGHFYNHQNIGCEVTKIILNRLGYNHDLIKDVLMLIEYHDYPLYLQEKPMKKFLNRFDNSLIDKLLILKKADIKGQNPRLLDRLKYIDEIKEYIQKCI